MAVVFLMDQRESRTSPDLVGTWAPKLNGQFGHGLTLPFTRTAGDEMQAVIGQADVFGRLVQTAVTSGEWWLGIGLGAIEEPRPTDPREGRGSAFWAARDAVDRAKGQRSSRPVAVTGEDRFAATAEELEECLGALAFIISRRTKAQRRVVEAWELEPSVQAVADRLNLSVQGARQRILAAGCEEADGLVRLAGRIAAKAVKPWD